MSMIRVTSSRLREAAESLQKLNSQFKNRSEELQGKEKALSQMWEGQAQTAFHGAFLPCEGSGRSIPFPSLSLHRS